MIEEVLNEIAAAEKKAGEIIENALEQSKAISFSAQSEIESVIKDFEARLKSKLAEIDGAAEKEAIEQAAVVEKRVSDSTAEILTKAEKNVQRCVEFIAEKLSKTK